MDKSLNDLRMLNFGSNSSFTTLSSTPGCDCGAVRETNDGPRAYADKEGSPQIPPTVQPVMLFAAPPDCKTVSPLK
jgi:hypothetical protein